MEAPVSAWQPTDLPAEGPRAGTGPAPAAALEAVMRQHNQRLFRLALSLVGNPHDAEDVLQDSYFRAFDKRASFAGRSGLGAWLASIVRNQAMDGRFQSLAAVVAHYERTFSLRLTDGEKRDLVEYLKSLWSLERSRPQAHPGPPHPSSHPDCITASRPGPGDGLPAASVRLRIRTAIPGNKAT